MNEELIERLCGVVPGGEAFPHKYRNPDGPEAADELERLQLTDNERAAIRYCRSASSIPERIKGDLRRMLERLQ
jgi:hypothetical protein